MSPLHEHPGSSPQGADWSRINQWLLWLGLAAAVGWLFFRHNEHLLRLLPFLIILACPLMHVFGHGGHGDHGKGGDTQPGSAPSDGEARRGGGGHVH